MPDDTFALRESSIREDKFSPVVTELLQLVGLHAPAEPEEEAAASGYGKGLDKFGFANYAKAAIPSKLKRIVEAPTPTMIGSADWRALADEQAAAADKTRLDLKALVQDIATSQSQTEADELSAAVDKLLASVDHGKEVDLGKFGKVPPADIETKWWELNTRATTAREKAAAEAKKRLAMNPDRAAAALRLADDPRNNPERNQVTEALKQLEASTAKLTSASPQQQASAQFAQLNEVQKVLFAWNDRRTRENLPPSAEALALGDLVQRMQREAIRGIAERGDDLPLPAGIDPTDAAAAQRSWKNMCASGKPGWIADEGNRINVPVPTQQQAAACKSGITAEQAKQFRVEILSNFAQLMQTDAGRSLVNKLNTGKHQVSILPGDEAAAVPDGAFSGSRSRTKGQGSASRVLIPPGGCDSDTMYQTDKHNVLTVPSAVTMGHELVHALHNSRGTNRGALQVSDDEMEKWKSRGIEDKKRWTDAEEYQTIFKGKISEQTLRAQMGLSATRFGHVTQMIDSPDGLKPVSGELEAVFEDAIKTDAEIAEFGADKAVSKPGREEIDRQLKQRKIDPAALTDRQKLDILKSDLAGPLPDGWPCSTLSVDQLKSIVANKLDYRKFQPLGWSAFDVKPTDLVAFIAQEVFYDRTPQGLAFQRLGGDTAVKKMTSFAQLTGANMPQSPAAELAGACAGLCTTGKLKALEQAPKAIDAFMVQAKDEISQDALSKTPTGGTVTKRLDAIEAAWKFASTGIVNQFENSALRLARPKDSEIDKTDLVDKMVTAMQDLGLAVKSAMQDRLPGLFIDEAVEKARTAIAACQIAEAGTLTSKSKTAQRAALCKKFGGYLQGLDDRIKSVRARVDKSVNIIRARTGGYTAEDVETLKTLLKTPLLSRELYQKIQGTLSSAQDALQ